MVASQSPLRDNYADDHCENHYQVERGVIIRTEDSRQEGALFLNESRLPSLARCLHSCCAEPGCNTAVYDTRMDTAEGGSCYLFDCGPLDALKCQFTSNSEFTSAVLDTDRSNFEASAAVHRDTHRGQLDRLTRDCGRFEFRCQSGECIPVYDVSIRQ